MHVALHLTGRMYKPAGQMHLEREKQIERSNKQINKDIDSKEKKMGKLKWSLQF